MASDDAVTVYQDVIVDFEQKRSERCSGCSSPPDPVEVARNLLLDDHDSRKFTIVSSREFKPWYGEYLMTGQCKLKKKK